MYADLKNIKIRVILDTSEHTKAPTQRNPFDNGGRGLRGWRSLQISGSVKTVTGKDTIAFPETCMKHGSICRICNLTWQTPQAEVPEAWFHLFQHRI